MQANNIQFQYKTRRQERPSRHIMQKALGLSPTSYKNYLASHLINAKQEQQNVSSRNSVKNRNPSYHMRTEETQYPYPNQQSRLSNNKNYVKNLIIQRREQNQKRKQQMMRKVKQLQEKVLPMIENDRESNMNQFGWQNRMEQKILKLETYVDEMKKDLQINMERKLIQVEQRWQQKYQEIEALVQASLNSRENT